MELTSYSLLFMSLNTRRTLILFCLKKSLPLAIITAVFADNDGIITFKYQPKSFRNGLVISIASLIAIVSYFAYSYIKAGGQNKG